MDTCIVCLLGLVVNRMDKESFRVFVLLLRAVLFFPFTGVEKQWTPRGKGRLGCK